jgi:predicted phage terminase large subunit-like protein
MCIDAALDGQHVWWVAPTFPLAEQGWAVIERMVSRIPETRTEGRPIWRATLSNGGSIQAKSADNPDSLRGATLDGLVLDEAAIAKPNTWPTLRPTLTVRKGWAMFISTPKGTNWFYDLYEGVPKRKGWARWQIPSVDSPFVPPDDVEASRQEMSSLLFAQEFLAEFISYSSGIFRADWFVHYQERFEGDERVYVLGDEAIRLADCTKFHTVDLAWTTSEDSDYTVISSWAQTPHGHLIMLDMVRGRFEGPDVVPKLRQAYERWGGVLVVEKATRQASIIQEAHRTGLPIREVKPDKDKIARSDLAAARMSAKRIWFPPASTTWFSEVEDELLAFPAGRHDDIVDTVAYAAIHGANRSRYEDGGLTTV